MNQANYIGIDAASEVCVVHVLDGSGKTVSSSKVVTEAKALRAVVDGVPRPRHVVFEEGCQSEWMYEVLEGVSDCLIVAPSTQLRNERHKGDDRDAQNLAERLRLGDIKPVWHGGGARRRKLAHLMRWYNQLTKDSTRLKNRLRAVYRSEGIKASRRSYCDEGEPKSFKKLSKEQQLRVKDLREMLAHVSASRKMVRELMVTDARRYDLFKRVTRAPQIGDIYGAIITAILWHAERFRNRRQLWSYCGFAVKSFDTGEYRVEGGSFQRRKKHKTRGLSKDYNRVLKGVFKSAAKKLSQGEWKERFEELCTRMPEEMALLTLARKIAAIVLRLAKSGMEYDGTLAFKRSV